MSHWTMIFHVLYTLLFFKLVQALATNRTIDDQYGDSATGAMPSYSPGDKWAQGNQCSGCFAQLDPQQTFDHSWHDATVHSGDIAELSISMSFSGTAVYAYCILDNANGYTTFTNLTFSIDGAQVGGFSHSPDGSGSFLYNTLVYANSSIPDGNHIFVIHSPTAESDALVLFDYVVYTSDTDSPTSSTSTPTSTPTQSSHSINRTIDDQSGDSATGALPSYSPGNKWAQGNQCPGCFAQPDPQQTFDHSWHDGTVHSGDAEDLSITISFSGTAVYAYCILDNAKGYTTFTNLTFAIDGAQVGAFSHSPDGSGSFLHNVLVYANASMPDGNHTFVIRSPKGGADALILFDYVQYTSDANSQFSSTSSSSSVTWSTSTQTPVHLTNSKTAGGIAGGIICGAAILLLFFLYWSRRSRPRNSTPPDTLYPLEGPSSNMDASATMSSHPLASYPPWQSASQPFTEQSSSPDRPRSDSSSPPYTSETAVDVHREPDPVLESQVASLQQEVRRLREMVEGNMPPPQYHD